VKVTVRLIGPLAYTAGFSEKEITLAASATAADALAHVHLGKARQTIVTRNGRAIADHDGLEDGDRLTVSPVYSGG